MKRRIGAALAAVALLTALLTVSAQAQEEAGLLGLAVVTGYDGQGSDADWTPVEVRMEPLRPVRGTLVVEVARDSSAPFSVEREIEVAAASRVAYRFLMPAGSVAVEFHQDGAETVSVRAPRPPASGFLVGVLGSLPALAPPLRSEATGMSGSWVGVDPAWLAVSEQALEPLGTLVAGQGALASLPPDARENLATAVTHGADIVVVAEQQGRVDLAALGLPDPLQATAGGGGAGFEITSGRRAWEASAGDLVEGAGEQVVAAAAAAGRGRVTVVGAAVGQGTLGQSSRLWSAVTGPHRYSGDAQTAGPSDWNVAQAPHRFPAVLAGRNAGLPTVPWLAAFIVLYVLIVGPVSGFFLARLRRRELAWVTVPVITAAFTAATFVTAVGSQPELGVAGRVLVWVGGSGTETVLAGVRSPTPTTGEVALPGTGWTVRTVADRGEGGTLTVGQDTRIRMDLDALQFAGVMAVRHADAPQPLSVDAVPRPGGLEVTVTNRTEGHLHAVEIRAGTIDVTVGRLAPGQAKTVPLDVEHLDRVDPWSDPWFEQRPNARRGRTALADVLRAGVLDGNPGLVWAVAGTQGTTPEVQVAGEAAEDRGTLYVVGSAPASPERAAGPAAVARALVAAEGGYRPGPLAVEGPDEAILRFRPPATARGAVLRSDLERSGRFGNRTELSVWDQRSSQWVAHDRAFAGGTAAADRFVSPLGEVYVRATGDLYPFDYSARTVTIEAEQGT